MTHADASHTRAVTPATEPWVCLMYHEVVPHWSASAGSEAWFAVSKQAFERQLALIAEAGFAGCSLEDALARPGERRVAITFDDGSAGQHLGAFPALIARRMTATFFVTTGWIGRPGYVSWSALREMKAAGMSIQSHTHSHPFLSELGAEQVRDELVRSKDALDQGLEQATDALSLPNGDWPRAAARHLVREAGYALVATSRWGVNRAGAGAGDGPLRVRRCTVRGEPTALAFQRVLRRDAWLFLARGARESVLGALRSGLGPTRYARWRRVVVDALAGRP